jgi:hypothetical protein
MNPKKAAVMTSIAKLLAVALVTTGAAHAATVTYVSDADFLANAQFTKQFGYNVKNGNSAANGDWEYAIVDGADVPQFGSQQLAWGNNTQRDHDFSFAYDGSAIADLDLTNIGGLPALADQSNSGDVSGLVSGSPNAIFIRAKDAGSNSQVDLGNLAITFLIDNSVINLGSLIGDADAAYVGVIDSRVAGGFTITGDVLLNTGDSGGGGSTRMYQAKIGLSNAVVPVPAAVWLFGGALAALGVLKRRQR